MLENVYIIGPSGDVVIEKHWVTGKGPKLKRSVVDLFLETVGEYSSIEEAPPVIETPKYILCHISRFGLSLLSVARRELNPLSLLELLHALVDVLVFYFEGHVSESMLRKNFSIVYQILDEFVDGGFPYTTELNQLSLMILQPSLTRRLVEAVSGKMSVTTAMPKGALGKIPWRKSDVKYVSNEIYLDIVERVDVTFDAHGNVQHSSVFGEIECNCKLSGLPDLTLHFQNPSMVSEASLHRCVRINKFARSQALSFVPPDGKFTLMSFKLGGQCNVPVFVLPEVHYSEGGGTIKITVDVSKLKAVPEKGLSNITLTIPFPKQTISAPITVSHGDVSVDMKTQICTWNVGRHFRDNKPVVLEGNIVLPLDCCPSSRPTITAQFGVTRFSATGLKVASLEIANVKYKPVRYVRSITKAGRYQVRA